MARREFSTKTKAAAFLRCDGFCEGTLADGSPCRAKLTLGKYEFDHDDPDGLTGEPTLENCVVLCVQCHRDKTKVDVANIAKAKRREAKHLGLRKAKGRPLAGTKASGIRKRMNGQVERW